MSKRPKPESWEEVDRNTRLFSHASEMLSMLKRLATISTMDEAWDAELQDLIEKVEGRK